MICFTMVIFVPVMKLPMVGDVSKEGLTQQDLLWIWVVETMSVYKDNERGKAMKKVAVISAILEEPINSQHTFNDVVASYKGLVRGRMGLPLHEEGVTVITLTVVGDLDEINSLTGKIGRIEHVQVKTAISKKDVL